MRKISGLLTLCVFAALAVHGSTVLNVSEDAYVMMTDPDSNFGAEDRLLIHLNANTNVSYVKFDASGLSGIITNIVSIEAFARSASNPRGASVYLLTNAVGMSTWSEDTITWNNAPGNDLSSQYPLSDESLKIGSLDKPAASTSETVAFSFDDGTNGVLQHVLMDVLNTGDRIATLVLVRPTDRYQSYASLENTETGSHPVRMTVDIAPGQILNVSEDAYVMMTDPDTNTGSEDRLKVHDNSGTINVTYLKFDASELGTVTNISAVQAFARANSTERTSSVYLLTNAVGMSTWSEDTITWNNAPGNDLTSKYLLSDVAASIGSLDKPLDSVSMPVPLIWDAGGRDLLMDMLNTGDRIVTLVLIRPSDKFQTYASLESTELGAFPARIILQAEPGSGYGAWADQYGLVGSEIDDDDGDGLKNLYEYSIGGNPTNAADTGNVPIAGIINDGGTNFVEYVYARRIGSESELSYYLELNDNLVSGSWTNVGYIALPAAPIDAEFEAVTNRVQILDASKFIRLKIDSL